MIVLISQPLKNVFIMLEVMGRLVQISIELAKYDIKYMYRTTMMGQVLVEFVANFYESPEVTSDVVKEEVCGVDQRERLTW